MRPALDTVNTPLSLKIVDFPTITLQYQPVNSFRLFHAFRQKEEKRPVGE